MCEDLSYRATSPAQPTSMASTTDVRKCTRRMPDDPVVEASMVQELSGTLPPTMSYWFRRLTSTVVALLGSLLGKLISMFPTAFHMCSWEEELPFLTSIQVSVDEHQ